MENKKILLVDDCKTALMMSQMLLKRLKFEVVVARDGQEAVEKAVEVKPDLILMDVIMPKMTGFEAVRAIRSMNGVGQVPIIMLTTKGEQRHIDEGYQSGCNDYVTKPIQGREFLDKVRAWIG